MSTYFADKIALTTTPVKVIDADDGDRRVHVGGTGDVYVGFDSTHARSLVTSSTQALEPFVLPGGEELWAGMWSGTGELHILVTQV